MINVNLSIITLPLKGVLFWGRAGFDGELSNLDGSKVMAYIKQKITDNSYIYAKPATRVSYACA